MPKILKMNLCSRILGFRAYGAYPWDLNLRLWPFGSKTNLAIFKTIKCSHQKYKFLAIKEKNWWRNIKRQLLVISIIPSDMEQISELKSNKMSFYHNIWVLRPCSSNFFIVVSVSFDYF